MFDYEREETSLGIGDTDAIFTVNEDKTIHISKNRDNSITDVWLINGNAETAIGWYEAKGLLYLENICNEDGDLDTDMLAMAEKCFEVAYEA